MRRSTAFTHASRALLTACLLLAAACSDEPGSHDTSSMEMGSSSPPADSGQSMDMSTPSTQDQGMTTPADMDRPTIASGMTSCGRLPTGEEVSCQPSQHCADATLNRCDLGCLSDMNCPGNEHCVKDSGQSVGLCQRKAGAEGSLPDDPTRTGTSDCGFDFDGSSISCQPSQYCADSTLAQCQTGCLSDFNCPHTAQCNKSAGKNVGACEERAPVDPCAGISCDAGKVCVDGACVSDDPCAGVSCDAGKVCVDGACVSQDPCAGVSCGANEMCSDGVCVPTASSCIPNATAQDGCPVDHICIFDQNDDTVCFKFPACDAQNDCAPGLEGAVCSTEFIQGKSPQCLPTVCLDDSHCPNTWKCVTDAGDPAGFCDTGEFGSFCADDQDCGPGLICDDFSETCG